MMIDERGTVTHPLRCGQTVDFSGNPGNDNSNGTNSQTSLSSGKAGGRAPWVGHQGSGGVGSEVGAVYSEVFCEKVHFLRRSRFSECLVKCI